MGLVRLIGGLPLLPLRGVLRLAAVVRDQANRELHDPVAVQRALADIARRKEAGLLSGEEAARLEHEAFKLLIWQEDR